MITAVHTLKYIIGGQQSFKEYCIDLQDKTVVLQLKKVFCNSGLKPSLKTIYINIYK